MSDHAAKYREPIESPGKQTPNLLSLREASDAVRWHRQQMVACSDLLVSSMFGG
jgi:hypothetical protein